MGIINQAWNIEGVPEGWELVRIGSVDLGEFVLGPYGDIMSSNVNHSTNKNYVIVRKIEPPKPMDPGQGWRLLEPHEAKQKGDECNFLVYPNAKWQQVDLCCMKLVDMVYRRRIEPPKPVYIPWTYETCPVGAVVKRKQGKFRGEISVAKEDGVIIGAGHYSYEELLEDFELAGTPCGTADFATPCHKTNNTYQGTI